MPNSQNPVVDSTRRSPLLLAAALCACLVACSTNPVIDTPPADPAHTIPAELYATWNYNSDTKYVSNGTSQQADITGTLTFTNDQRWTMNRDVGRVLTTGAGSVVRDTTRLVLLTDKGDTFDTYTFSIVVGTSGHVSQKSLTLNTLPSGGTYYQYYLLAQ